jgi:hemoglobin-like flavoprotein
VTPERVRLVEASWAKFGPVAENAVKTFYGRLFEIDPSTVPLFRAVDMPEQRRKLAQSLALAVQSLRDPDAFVAQLEDLGRRHADYRVTDAHYEAVRTALLWTLERELGPAWTPDVADAWREAYDMLADAMKRGA